MVSFSGAAQGDRRSLISSRAICRPIRRARRRIACSEGFARLTASALVGSLKFSILLIFNTVPPLRTVKTKHPWTWKCARTSRRFSDTSAYKWAAWCPSEPNPRALPSEGKGEQRRRSLGHGACTRRFISGGQAQRVAKARRNRSAFRNVMHKRRQLSHELAAG